MRIIEKFKVLISKPKLSPRDSLCENRWTFPVVSLARGEFRFCCHSEPRKISEAELLKSGSSVFMNSAYDQARRLEMLQGERHPDCKSCWKLEDVGIKSSRLLSPDFSKEQKFTTPVPLENWGMVKSQARLYPEWRKAQAPVSLEVMLGNACDMKCLYCNQSYSSKWAQELVQFGDMTREQVLAENPSVPSSFEPLFWKSLEEDMLTQLEQISIIGGEPLSNVKLYRFLDLLEQVWLRVKAKRTRGPLRLVLVTNLNATSEQLNRFIERVRAFDGRFVLELDVSMEAFGQRAEYIRYGLNWQRWLTNLHGVLAARLCKSGIAIQLTTNALSITSLKDLLMLFKQLMEEYNTPILLRQNIVTSPAYLSPLILPAEFAEQLDECVDYLRSVQSDISARFEMEHWGRWDFYGDYLSSIASSIRRNTEPSIIVGDRSLADHYQELRQFIEKIDFRRGLSFKAKFPEYWACSTLMLDASPQELRNCSQSGADILGN